MKTHENFAGETLLRAALYGVGILLAAFLALTLETGRAHAAGGVGISMRGALSRFISPNGDIYNPLAILCVENPKDSSISGRIYDLRGHVVASMTRVRNAVVPIVTSCKANFPPQQSVNLMDALTWDGMSNGIPVSNGVYIYRLEAEETAVTGTVVVAR